MSFASKYYPFNVALNLKKICSNYLLNELNGGFFSI